MWFVAIFVVPFRFLWNVVTFHSMVGAIAVPAIIVIIGAGFIAWQLRCIK